MEYIKKNANTSPLHRAAQGYDYKTLQQLLRDGINPNERGEKSRTPIHVLLLDGFLAHLNTDNLEKCLTVLLQFKADPNSRDVDLNTPLYLATKNNLPTCVKILLSHGADISTSPLNETGNIALATTIGLSMHDILLDVFDDAVTFEYGENEESEICLDWGPVLQYRKIPKKGEDQLQYYEPGRNQKETSFLYTLLEGDYNARKRLLTHPLISAFVHLKYQKVYKRLGIFYFGVVVYPIFYFLFIEYLYFLSCNTKDNITNNSTNTSDTKTRDIECEILLPTTICAYFLTVVVVIWSGIEIYMLIRMNGKPLGKWRTWVTGITLTLMTLALWPGLQFETLEISFQVPIAALSIFFSCVLFLLQIGSYPGFAVYIEVLVQILLSVLKICLLFLPLLIGFYMGFTLIFDNTNSVFLFIIMMFDVGTADYEDIVDRARQNDWWFESMSYIFCIAFIVIITVVFLNFVLGSAINNIQKFKYEAKLSNIARRIENLLTVDVLDSRCRLVTSDAVMRGQLHFKFSPNKDIKVFPEDIRRKLIEILKIRQAKESDKADQSDLTQKIKKLEQKLNEITLKLDSIMEH